MLEWRLDPAARHRIPEAQGPDLHVIVICRQGYSSSLAAASLQAVGLHRATDIVGGVEAWLAAGLPLSHAARRRARVRGRRATHRTAAPRPGGRLGDLVAPGLLGHERDEQRDQGDDADDGEAERVGLLARR